MAEGDRDVENTKANRVWNASAKSGITRTSIYLLLSFHYYLVLKRLGRNPERVLATTGSVTVVTIRATGATTMRFNPLNSYTVLSYFAKCQRLRCPNRATLVKRGDYSWFRTAPCHQNVLPLNEPLTPAYSNLKPWLLRGDFKPP